MLSSDFKEFCTSLNAADVKYLIVGGYAVAFHGHPRYTGDIDIWVEASMDNGSRIENALLDFGFADLDLSASDFAEPDTVFQLGFPPNRIDILTALEGVSFQDCYPRRQAIESDGMVLPVTGIEDLGINKRALGRPQDLADLHNLGLAPKGDTPPPS
jgi:hypothetical protein